MLLYIVVFSLPVLHPSIAVPYDRSGWWLWFFLVPGEMLISYYLSPPRFRISTWVLFAAGFLFVSILVFSGFNRSALLYIGAGSAVFLLTALIFKTGNRGYPFAVIEQFFLAFLLYKLLSFSRASESIAQESSGLTQALLILIVFSFLIHGMVLYFAAFHRGKIKRPLKELFLFLLIAAPLILLFIFLIPGDFVSHSMVFNVLGQEPKPKPIPLDEYGEGPELGNLLSSDGWDSQRSGRDRSEDLQNGDQGGEGVGTLEGVPSDEWPGQGSGVGKDSKQYAVMVVASSINPVYAAEGYFGDFDSERGFLLSEDQTLNDLSYIRLLETWVSKESSSDLMRYPQSIFYLSTLPARVLAYKPHKIEPTVYDKKYHPFDYSYDSVSLISWSGGQDWMTIGELSEEERESLKSYLEIDLPDELTGDFNSYLANALDEKSRYFERVYAIFKSFSRFHYELGFADDVSVSRMWEFLVHKKRGDCTEFSNTAAILARMAGIPSRVVTGYLAAKELQTLSHWRGLRILQEVIEPLQSFPLQNLFLVTTAHRHSWVQLYMPGYGWVDFDPTSFAIPPIGGGPNAMNVVIPLIQIEENPPVVRFPWMLMAQLGLILLIVLLITLYLYRYGKELWLRHLSKGQSIRALRALYTLLLMKLCVNGYAIKIPSKTPMEYSESYPELIRFSSIYTTLRYGNSDESDKKASLWNELRTSYKWILRHFRSLGFFSILRRVFSLKGLYYKVQ